MFDSDAFLRAWYAELSKDDLIANGGIVVQESVVMQVEPYTFEQFKESKFVKAALKVFARRGDVEIG